MAFIPRFSPAHGVQIVALLAALAGVVIWTPLLLTPAESHTPQAAPQVLAARSDNPALQWFSNAPTALQVKVSGVLAGARGAVAILSLNDGPPRSFLLGEHLSPGVRLTAIEGDGVEIERGGEKLRVKRPWSQLKVFVPSRKCPSRRNSAKRLCAASNAMDLSRSKPLLWVINPATRMAAAIATAMIASATSTSIRVKPCSLRRPYMAFSKPGNRPAD